MSENNNKNLIIAVDGFSSTGKSTLAQDIAKHYGIRYIDSGAMYRAVTLYAVQKGLIDQTTSAIQVEELKKELDKMKIDFKRTTNNQQSIYLNNHNVDKEIRQMAVNNQVSHISKIRFVREKMVEKQREFSYEGGLVMDGRDIGTEVFPDAEIKLFMTASAEIRAERRFKELKEKGIKADYNEVLNNLKERDAIDQGRETSPLKKAPDAFEIDNSNLSREEQLKKAISLIDNR